MKILGGAVVAAIGCGVGFSLILTGCGDVSLVAPTASVSDSASSTSSETPTATTDPSPSATVPLVLTPSQAKSVYKQVAKASCNWAQRDGVAEVGSGYTAVMTNSAQAYQGFTEARLLGTDAYTVLTDLSDFYSCADWYLFSMADEAGKEAALNVTYNSDDGTFNVRKVLASGAPSALKIVVSDGVIATVTNLDPTNPFIIGCRYGSLTPSDLAVVKTAVDRQLNGQ